MYYLPFESLKSRIWIICSWLSLVIIVFKRTLTKILCFYYIITFLYEHFTPVFDYKITGFKLYFDGFWYTRINMNLILYEFKDKYSLHTQHNFSSNHQTSSDSVWYLRARWRQVHSKESSQSIGLVVSCECVGPPPRLIIVDSFRFLFVGDNVSAFYN